MRPIDADKLKAKQQEDADLFIDDDTLSGKSRRDEALNAVANIVNAPTIDAVPVVRCRECEFYNGDQCHCANDIFAEADDYCSYGVRREDEAQADKR